MAFSGSYMERIGSTSALVSVRHLDILNAYLRIFCQDALDLAQAATLNILEEVPFVVTTQGGGHDACDLSWSLNVACCLLLVECCLLL
eukprot:CAMPEP_0198112596 /NCGR_PEP_ID=MMETSP1442-20131203/4421_1 /TAXON_ID= /ORGANISM="Craspedostauros australis, Strain CCMP3328" /LENGTH=87 /DNA_ID=CAMNT_0043769421 /DNA_START=80 /DNA_END=340 /DNA_ORIENTATION=+